MPHIKLVVADQPLGQRLAEGVRYPLTGAGLMACVGLGLCWYLTLLPGIVGLAFALVVWGAAFAYAIDCLVLTADGYAEPPEVSMYDRAGNSRGMLVLHVLVLLGLVAVAMMARYALWPIMLVVAVLLPALDMSLAFDGDPVVALSPVTWMSIAARFGVTYAIPVLANIAVVMVMWLVLAGAAWLPRLIALPVCGFTFTFLLLLNFHWMGLLVWHYRERLGMSPQAPQLADAMGQDGDDQLLRECEALVRDDPEEAAIRLRDRIRERIAPEPVHKLFRTLLRQLGRNDLLLQHGQAWIAQLCANGMARRALGLVQECRGIDPKFVPDDPGNAADLAELAARIGMRDLAGHLVRTLLERWPHHAAATRLKQVIGPR